MPLSLGRTLYNLTGRNPSVVAIERPARPGGDLVWLHVPNPDTASTMLQLARRIIADLSASVLVTCPTPLAADPEILQDRAPNDRPADAKTFLNHWRPDLSIWSQGEIRPALLAEAASRRLPLLMSEAGSPCFPDDRHGWYPGLMRSSLELFQEIMALDDVSARAFRKAGAENVRIAGRMEEPSAALPYHEPERANLAHLLATRPVWLAAEVPRAEEAAVLSAHRSALRLAHRLLLILVPEDPTSAPELAARIETEEGWTVALRSRDQEPDPETEVYIPDSTAEFGLWYRLAPVTFLGGSLIGGGCLRNPMEPAALGSAIIRGPKSGAHAPLLNRLSSVGAARTVGSPHDLAEALGDLLAPDRSARLAQAAWILASDGVGVTDHILEVARDLLDGAT